MALLILWIEYYRRTMLYLSRSLRIAICHHLKGAISRTKITTWIDVIISRFGSHALLRKFFSRCSIETRRTRLPSGDNEWHANVFWLYTRGRTQMKGEVWGRGTPEIFLCEDGLWFRTAHYLYHQPMLYFVSGAMLVTVGNYLPNVESSLYVSYFAASMTRYG